MNRITSHGMPGMNDNDIVLTYYCKCDIIQTKNEIIMPSNRPMTVKQLLKFCQDEINPKSKTIILG